MDQKWSSYRKLDQRMIINHFWNTFWSKFSVTFFLIMLPWLETRDWRTINEMGRRSRRLLLPNLSRVVQLRHEGLVHHTWLALIPVFRHWISFCGRVTDTKVSVKFAIRRHRSYADGSRASGVIVRRYN